MKNNNIIKSYEIRSPTCVCVSRDAQTVRVVINERFRWAGERLWWQSQILTVFRVKKIKRRCTIRAWGKKEKQKVSRKQKKVAVAAAGAGVLNMKFLLWRGWTYFFPHSSFIFSVGSRDLLHQQLLILK